MKTITSSTGVLLLLVLGTVLRAGENAPALDEVVAANLAARGGLDRIRAVRSFAASGRLTGGDAPPLPFRAVWRRPDWTRIEIDFGSGLFAVVAGRAEERWWVNTFAGIVAPEPLPALFAPLARGESDFDGPLVDAERKGLEIRLSASQTVDGRPAFVVEAVRRAPFSETTRIFIDRETGLEVREVRDLVADGVRRTVDVRLSDYRPVGGLRLPHRIENAESVVELDAIRLDVPVPASWFSRPAGRPAPLLR